MKNFPGAMLRSAAGQSRAVILLIAAAAAACATRAPQVGQGVQPAAEAPSLKVVKLVKKNGSDDLPGLQVVDIATGAVFRVYHDSAAAATAGTVLPRLMDVYRTVADLLAVDAGAVQWSAVALVADRAYQPPRIGHETRWTLHTDAAGQLTDESASRIVWFIAHEQTHAVETTFNTTPRWFSEGLAAWVEVRATERLAPEQAAAVRGRYAVTAGDSARLAAWGGVSVRREAILRQVTAEQRQRMEREPGWVPPGPFSFGPGDFLTDTGNETLRYAAAHALFERVEQQAGTAGLQRWLRAVRKRGGALKTEELVALAKQETGLDLEPWLR